MIPLGVPFQCIMSGRGQGLHQPFLGRMESLPNSRRTLIRHKNTEPQLLALAVLTPATPVFQITETRIKDTITPSPLGAANLVSVR